MAANCFYHYGRATDTACAQCMLPICDECCEVVAGHSVCKQCGVPFRAKIRKGEIAPAEGHSPGPAPNVPWATVAATPAADPAYYAAVSTPIGPVTVTVPAELRFAYGLAAGLAAGLAVAFVWEKCVFYLGFLFGPFTAAIGFTAAFALVQVSGAPTRKSAICAAALAFVAQIVGYMLLTFDNLVRTQQIIVNVIAMLDHSGMQKLSARLASLVGPAHFGLGDILSALPGQIGLLGLLYIAAGCWVAYITPRYGESSRLWY